MNIPASWAAPMAKFLSRLHLPLWAHICPKCRKEVKANSHECPYCGEKYPLTLKVPPTFLKDKKKLEAYVHEHVFSRISEFERNYLTQYFTVLFSDGFESGTFSAWTGGANGALVQSSIVHSGVYAVDFPVVNSECWITSLPTSNEVNVRFYVYFGAVPSFNGILSAYDNTYSNNFLLTVNGKWQLAVNGNYFQNLGSTPTANTWYCIEVGTSTGTGNAVVNLWVNGVNILSNSAQTITYPFNQFYFKSNGEEIVYLDDVVVADAYIGPLSSTTNINVSDSGSGSDAVAVTASMTVTETGSGSDAISALQANVPVSDAGLGSDALSSVQTQIPVSDAGAGADNVGVQGTIPVSDVGSGADSIASLQGQIPVYDSGLGMDVIASLKALIPIADSGLGTDSLVLGSPVTLSDSGLGTDSVVIQAQILINDVGTGLDLAIVKVNTIISDVGLGSDVLTVSVPISISDVGLGVDSVVVVVLSSLPTHAIIIQSETGKITLQSEKGNVALQSEKGAVTLQSDSD